MFKILTLCLFPDIQRKNSAKLNTFLLLLHRDISLFYSANKRAKLKTL